MRPIVFGLDISDRSAELVTLIQKKSEINVTGYARIELPPGTVAQGVIQDPDQLAASLLRMFDSAFGTKRGHLTAGVSLPEMLVYSKTFSLPASLAPDLAQKALVLDASDTFPIAVAHAVTDMAVLSRDAERQDILFAAADREAAKGYLAVLARVGVQPLFFDAESMALSRALIDPRIQEPVLVADIGARTTIITVHDKVGVRTSGNVMVGGDSLNAAIERKLGVTLAQAEEMRRKAGFDPGIDDGRLFLIMEKPMGEIIAEMKRTIVYYEGKTGRKVAAIVLAGGTSLTPGIVDYLASNFPALKVVQGNPLRGLSFAGLPEPDSFRRTALLYSTAIGLALRAMGARASPGLNLIPVTKRSGGALGGIKEAFSNLISMATHSKKTSPKKKRASKEAPLSVSPAKEEAPVVLPEQPPAPPEPVRMQIDVAPAKEEEKPPAPLPAEPEKKAAPKKEDKKAADSVADLMAGLDNAPAEAEEPMAPKIPEKPAAPEPTRPARPAEASEEKDYGLGIGDILGSEDAIDPSKVGENDDLGPTVDAKAASRRSIESILSRGKVPAKAPRPRPAPQPLAPAGYVPKRGISKTAILLIIVVLLFAAAAGGIYMFVRKNGVPKYGSVAGMFGKTAKPPAAPATNQAPVPAAPQTVNVTVLVATNPPKDSAMPVAPTRVIETDVKQTDSFPASGEGKSTASAGRSTGKATIINDTAKSYTFVATTRLLSKEGVLFRMKSQSPIPAKGSVTVDVYADQPGPSGDIGPTTFTIPGLPPALQKDIYAKSDVAMSGGAAGAAKGHTVTQADIDAAKKALTDKLKKEADGNFAVIVQDGEKLLPDLETSSELSSTAPKVGAAGDKFTLTLSLRFRALVVPEKAVLPLLQKAMTDSLPAGASAVDYSLGSVIYTVQAFPSSEEAQVRAEAPVIKK